MIEKNKTWDLVEKPQEKEVVEVKWVYKVKVNEDESFQRKKTRLVAKATHNSPELTMMKYFKWFHVWIQSGCSLHLQLKNDGYCVNLMSNQPF